MIDKVVASAHEAVADIVDGATILVGGFGFAGVPENLLRALADRGVGNLTCVAEDAGLDDWGLGALVRARRIRKMIAARVGEHAEFERQILTHEIEAELLPVGTLVERLRAGGTGIPAFFTPTGYGTVVADGKETREFGGRTCLLEHAITGNFSLIAAWKGDRLGNLVYRKSARNLNPIVATAGRICIAEVEELVEVGQLDPDHVHTPGIFVHRVVVAPRRKSRD
jgi:3-oxoacid CoA-transferase subunit A